MNQTLVNAARCMILESGMSKRFWADAMASACYFRNKCPTSANDDIPPCKLWMGKMTQLNEIKVWGYQSWAKNTKI